VSNGVQKSETPAWKRRAQVDEAEEERKFEQELVELERKAVEKAKSSLKAPRLNIEKNPRPIVESKKQKEVEVMLVKQLCGAYKAEVKLDEKAAAAREEKKKDLEVVRSARSFFKTVDKQRSESMSAVPRIRFRTEEEVSDSYTRGNRQRLSQFEPGKIHSKFSDIFGQTSQEGAPNVRPPKKKLITLDEKSSGLREEISSLNSTPVKARWQQPADGGQERPRSMEVHKLDLNQVFGQENKSLSGSNQDISRELEEIRDSRPTPVTKRWRPAQQNRESAAARSQSAHSLRRTRLPDDAWVVERSASRLEEERLKAVQELEEVKRARQETLEVIENGELERPSSRAEAENRTKALRELEEVKLVQLSHEKRVQDSYKKTDGNAAEKAKEEIYRETIASQRAKRERFESESKEGDKPTEREEIADLTMEDIALAIAMESLEDIDGILNRLNQPDSEDTDIENLKSEMETLVDKAEQIEANLENIEHMDQEVQIVVNDYDEEENLDDEVRMITSDLGDRRGKGLSAFEPGRISDNFMKRFDSPTVNEEVAVSRPKKKLISFEQVMRRTPSSSEDMRQQRDVELDEVRNVRKSWCPPDESELSFNKISKSATVPDRLKITSVYCNDKKEPLAGKEERSRELLELRQSRSGDVRKAMKGDSSWVREKANHGGERSRTQAELAALREARRDQVEEVDQLYSTRQELEEKARLQRELEELRGNKGSTVRSIRKELEEINMGVAIREGEEREEVRKMFSDPSSAWQEERRRIQSEAERPSAASWENDVEPRFNNIPKVEPVYSMPKEKVVKHVHLEDEVEVIPIQSSVHDKSEKLVMETTDEGSTEVLVESKKSEGKIKEKLALLKKQTEEEVMRMKEKTSGLVNSLKAQKEQTRGRSRKTKSEEEPVEQPSLRSKSISTIRNAGVKMKELAQMAGEPIQKGRKRKL